MKKTWVIGGIIVLAVGAGLAWFVMNNMVAPSEPPASTPSDDSSSASENANTGSAPSDMTQSTTVNISMKNTSFQPGVIKIKKGTTVTWTNEDFIQHNVVADSSNNVAGLPTDNQTFGKGGSYTFTFNKTGTITYHCSPHASSMRGVIEVVD